MSGPTTSSSSLGLSSSPVSEDLILQYLRSRGYSHTLETLERESGRTVSVAEMVVNSRMQGQLNPTNPISYFNRRENTPQWYTESYLRLKEFAKDVRKFHTSNPRFQDEVATLLWPIFVHMFLEMVKKGFTKDAAAFLEMFRGDHETHNTEIEGLSGISEPAQIPTNRVAVLYRKKVEIEMSSLTHGTLLSFLENENLMLLSRIIVNHTNIDVVKTASMKTEASQQEVISSKPIRWGIIKEFAELNKLARGVRKPKRKDDEKEEEGKDEAPEDDGDEEAKRRKKEDGKGSEVLESSPVPLPKLSEEELKKYRQDIAQRARVSAAMLPSICFYTFLNSHKVVNSISISNDASLVAGGGGDSSVRVWNLANKQSRCVKLVGHSGPVYGLSFSPDNTYLISGSEDRTVRMWHMDTKLPLLAYKGHSGPVWDVCFSPLGLYFATASYDGTARLWVTEKIYPLRIFVGHNSSVDCVRFHPNCNYVVTGSTDKCVRVWDIQDGSCVRVWAAHTAPVRCVAFSPDGRLCASGGEDKKVIVWEFASGQKQQVLLGHEKAVVSLCWSADGSILASGSMDHTVKLWNIHRSGEEPAMVKSFKTKNTPISFLHFTNRNLLLASGVFSA